MHFRAMFASAFASTATFTLAAPAASGDALDLARRQQIGHKHDVGENSWSPAYTLKVTMVDGGEYGMSTIGLGSKCHAVTVPGPLECVEFDAGWVEKKFTLYADMQCELAVFEGTQGFWDEFAGLPVGSWKVD